MLPIACKAAMGAHALLHHHGLSYLALPANQCSELFIAPAAPRFRPLLVQVLPGDELITIEAMKMRNVVKAEQAGAVRAIYVKQGDTVTMGQMLVDLE